MAAFRVDNFVVWLRVDDRNEETDCGTPNDPVLEITTVKDGDGDRADGVNDTGDDMGWYGDTDDWPAIDDGDTGECVVGINDSDDDKGGGDNDKDNDNDDDVVFVSGKVDKETEGNGAESKKHDKRLLKGIFIIIIFNTCYCYYYHYHYFRLENSFTEKQR